MTKRSFNLRFGIVLLVLIVITVPGTYALHRFQVQRNVEFLKNRSLLAENDKDLPKAISYLDRYLVLRPTDNDVRTHQAEMLAKIAKTEIQKEQALLATERSIREGATSPEIRRLAADLALETKRTGAARLHYNELLKLKPNDANVVLMLGRCEEIDAQPNKAVELYEKALILDPKLIDTYTVLARLYRTMSKPEQADQAIQRMVDNNPDNLDARLFRVNYLRIEKGQDPNAASLAAKDVAMVREKAPDRADAILASAQLAQQRGERDTKTIDAERATARKELAFGISKHPDDIRFPLALAELELRSDHPDAAAVALKEAERLANKKLEDMWLVANLYVTAGKPTEAAELLKKLSNVGGVMPYWLDYIEARIAMSERKWNDAVVKLERCRKEKDFLKMTEYAVNADVYLMQCYSYLGINDKRLEAIQRAVKFVPGSQDIRLAEADAHMMMGQVDEALAIYTAYADRSTFARFKAISLMLSQANSAGKHTAGELVPIKRLLDGTSAADQALPEFTMLKSAVMLVENKIPESRKLLEKARETNPNYMPFWVGLIELELRDNNIAGAEKMLAEAEAKLGDKVDLRLLKANIASRKNNAEAVKALVALDSNIVAFTNDERNRLEIGLSSFCVRAGALDEGRQLLTSVAKRLPEDLNVQLRLLDIVGEQGDLPAIEALVQHIKRNEGEDGATWRYADAVRLHIEAVKLKKSAADDAARNRLEEVRSRRPNWERAAVLEGIIEDSQQHIDKAIDAYMRAIALKTNSVKVVRRTVELLNTRRRYDEAAQVLNEFRDTQSSPELNRAAVTLAISRGDQTERTAAMALNTVNPDSKNPNDHIWLGQVYTSLKKIPEAEAAYRKAIALNPKVAAPRVSLIQLLASNGKLPQAKIEVEQAKKEVAALERDICLAVCYETVGDRVEAGKYYAALSETSPNDLNAQKDRVLYLLRGGELAAAESILRAMIEKSASDRINSIWPRRTLALSLAASGDYRRGTEALKLIDENLRAQPDSVDDQRAKTLILANRPGERRQSIKALQDMFVRVRPSPDEEFLLARLYEADGDWIRARDIYRSLVAKRGNENPRYVQQLVRSLLMRKEIGEAATLLPRLEPAEGQSASPQSIELKARLLHMQGKSMEAGILLKDFADRAYSANNNASVLFGVGRLMTDLGLTNSAESMIRQYVKATETKNPNSPLSLAEFFAKQNRVSDALDVCAQVLSKQGDPEFVASACIAVVRLGNPSETDFGRAASLIEQAMKARPSSTDIPVSRADLLDAQGKYDAAIAEYRAILSRQPNNILAANNLAWLLALRSNGQEALQYVNAAIAIAGPTENLLDTQGVIYLKLGRTDEAISSFSAAIEQTPEAHIYFHLALAQDKAKRTEDAIRTIRRAKELQLHEKNLHALEREEWRRLSALAPDVN